MSDDTRILFPAGVDGGPMLRPLYSPAWKARPEWSRNARPIGGTLYRRTITRDSPLRFALTYLPHYLRDRHTREIALADAHLDMARSALRWMDPRPCRDAWVLPREAGKSVWLFLVLPLWALAHGHRRFFLAFALTGEQAEGHLANLRAELAENELLLADYPELRQRKGPGSSATKRTTTVGGATIAARGMSGTTLGTRAREARPDLMLGDDLQPGPEKHTPERKATIETAVTASILPMGDRSTVVQLAGTTTMHGCLMHDVVRAALPESDPEARVAPWISAHGFTPHYYPAIVDEGTAAERSMWPARWTLDELREMRDTGGSEYALNYANRPEQAGQAGYWRRELIRYDPRVEVVRRILYADVAMTQRARSDQTALVLLGVDRSGRRAVIEHAELARIEGMALRERMWALTEAHRSTLKEWVIESNQGGDRWREIVAPVPFGVELDLEHVGGHKRSRIEVALKHYQRGAVVHRAPLTELEEQMLAWTPSATRDDGLDALAGALRRAFPPSA